MNWFRIKCYKPLYNIDVFKKLVNFVTIDEKYHSLIKLKVVENNLLNILIFDSMFNLRVGNSYKDTSYTQEI